MTTPSNRPNSKFDTPKNTGPNFDPKLLDILVCPVCHEPLDYDEAAQELVSKKAGLAYPIREGIAIMLPEEARTLV